ncbi:hypothetical protein [Nocardia sp. NPDC057440]|uniref:hypothetical protein n=1 Tax=Nocardia sp. NPDC057440 TaxID=3346134 RepID=UPI00366BFCFA
MVADDDTSSPNARQGPVGPPEPSAPPVSSSDLAALQRELELATRHGRYALVTAVIAAVISASASAWSSIHVSSTEMDRQQRFAAAQAVRTNRESVYVDFVAAYGDLASRLGRLRAALQLHPPDSGFLTSELDKLFEPMQTLTRAETAVRIVGSEMGQALARWDRTLRALTMGPESLEVVKDHLDQHQGGFPDDDQWRRISTVGISAIERFSTDTAVDEIAERAREDLGSG